MNRLVFGITFTFIFAFTYWVVPQILVELNAYNEISIMIMSIVNQLIITSVPVIILLSITEIPLLKVAGYSLLGINTGFLIIDIYAGVSGIADFSTAAGYAYILLVICNIGLFAAALNIGNEFYFGRRVKVFLVLLTIVIFLRYSPVLDPFFALAQDYNSNTGQGWDLNGFIRNLHVGFYVLTFILEVLALDAVLNEKEELGYE